MRRTSLTSVLLLAACLLPAALAQAADLKLVLPQERTAFQTNEQIDLTVIRSDKAAIPAQELTLTVTGAGSKMLFTFPLRAAAVAGEGAKSVEHLHLNGWLLSPGKYTLEAKVGDQLAKAELEVFSHIRKSSYRTIHWGGPAGDNMKGEGEEGMGFNLMMGGIEEISIREKMDIMGSCAMGGMHQHDGNLDCDWSDPNVYIGSIQRGMDRAMSFRTMPNCIGVHLHDEPGLTWNVHPNIKDKDGKPAMSPHDIASQRAAWLRAYGTEQPWADKIDTKDPVQLAQWNQVNEFKLGFMDAYWKASRDAAERIKPGFLAVTQSQYGWTALYDGYYFNVVRSMPVVSGHGGYNDFWLRNFNPSFFLEFSLPRQLDKPTWYLPAWYDNSSEQFKLEHYLAFVTGIQGVAAPPGLNTKSKGAPGVTEANRTIARLGTVFAKPAYTRQALAILYSRSDSIYRKEVRQPSWLNEVYMATKLIQQPFSAVLEEDVVDGTLAASHKAIIITGVVYLDPAVIAALSDFAKNGGLVLVTDDVKLDIPGATKLGYEVKSYDQACADALEKIQDADAKKAAAAKYYCYSAREKNAEPLAKALKEALAKHNIAPAFGSDNPHIAPGKQIRGEIEYIFAVNFAMEREEASGVGQPGATTATITLADDGRPVYDAMAGQAAKFDKSDKGLSAKIEFAAGDMKAFARTARPIGGVLVAAPTVSTDLTREQAPVQMTLAATLVDKDNKILSGAAPLQIIVTDANGKVRYDLYRATDAGVCTITLPLAANDAAGKWTVSVKELLSGTQGQASFEYKPLTRAKSLAGATRRAVVFGDDKANLYRFFRDQRNVTIAIGTGDYNKAQAERLAAALKPYNVTCNIVNAADVKARELSAEDARTWCGTACAGKLKAGRENAPQVVGWDLANPTIVMGTPQDNVMLAHMTQDKRNVLPYKVGPQFPGQGRGLLAWNLHTLGHDVQAIACVAYDAQGMAEAVGTLFEIAAGLEPLTPLALPTTAVVEVAK